MQLAWKVDEGSKVRLKDYDPEDTGDWKSKENADEARAEHRAERARRYPPSPDQVRRGKGDRRDVIAVDQDDEERPDQQLDLE